MASSRVYPGEFPEPRSAKEIAQYHSYSATKLSEGLQAALLEGKIASGAFLANVLIEADQLWRLAARGAYDQDDIDARTLTRYLYDEGTIKDDPNTAAKRYRKLTKSLSRPRTLKPGERQRLEDLQAVYQRIAELGESQNQIDFRNSHENPL